MLIRLEELDLIVNKKRKELTIDIIKEAQNFGYDTSIYLAWNDGLVIGDYGVKAKGIFDKEIYSYSHNLSLMKDPGIDLAARRICFDICNEELNSHYSLLP